MPDELADLRSRATTASNKAITLIEYNIIARKDPVNTVDGIVNAVNAQTRRSNRIRPSSLFWLGRSRCLPRKLPRRPPIPIPVTIKLMPASGPTICRGG